MILLGRLILPRHHQFIGHVGHVAADHRHLCGGIDLALLSDIPTLDCLRLAAVLLDPAVLARLWSGLSRGVEELRSCVAMTIATQEWFVLHGTFNLHYYVLLNTVCVK